MSRLNTRLAKLEKTGPQKLAPATFFICFVEPGGDLNGRIGCICDKRIGRQMLPREDESEGAFVSRFYRAIAPTGPVSEMSKDERQILFAGQDERIALLLAHDKPISNQALQSAIKYTDMADNGAQTPAGNTRKQYARAQELATIIH